MPRGVPKSGKRQGRSEERRERRPFLVDPNQLYSIDEAAAALDKSPAQLWADIRAGRIRSVRDGARVKMAGADIIWYVAQITSLPNPRTLEKK